MNQVEVYILSAYLSDSSYALAEKSMAGSVSSGVAEGKSDFYALWSRKNGFCAGRNTGR